MGPGLFLILIVILLLSLSSNSLYKTHDDALTSKSRTMSKIKIRIKNCFKNGSRPRKHFVRRGSGDRARTSLEAPAPGRRDGTIRSPASYPARARELQSSEVWCQPAGARKSRGRMPLSGLGPAPPTYDL